MQRVQAAVSKRFFNNNIRHGKLVAKRALLALAAGTACEMMFAHAAHGQTFTWTTASGTSNWSTGSNWVGGVPTSGASTVIDFFDPGNTLGPAAGGSVEGDVDAGLNGGNPFNLNILNLNGTTQAGTGSGTVIIGGTNTLTFAGGSGQINMNALFGAATGSGTTYDVNDAISFSVPTTITFNSASTGNLAFNDMWSGAGNVTVTDNNPARFVIVNGTATSAAYTGNVSVTAGVLSLGDGISNNNPNVLGANAAGTQSVTVSSGASVVFNNDDNASAQPQNFILNGGGTGAGGLGTDAALDANNISFGNNTIGSLDVHTNAAIRVDTNATPDASNRGLTVNGSLAGTGTLTKLGSGTLYLTEPTAAVGSDAGFTGNINVNQGVLETGNNKTNEMGGSAAQIVTVANNAALVYQQGNGEYTQPQSVVINGAGTGLGGAGTDAAFSVEDVDYGSQMPMGSLAVATNATVRVDQDA